MKFTKFTKSIAVFVMVLAASMFLWMGSTPVKAGSLGYISSLSMTDTSKYSLTVSWTPAENATSYNVYYKEYASQEDYIFAGTTIATSHTITGLNDGMKYEVKVCPVDATGEGYGKRVYDAFTLPDKLEGFKQKKWWYFIKQLEVEWEKQSGVDGFEVILYDNKNKKVSKKNLNSYYSSVSFSKMKDKVYTVKARSYKNYNGKKYYSSWSSICCLNQARITKATVSGNKLNVKWGKIAGATKYEVYVSTKPKSGYKKVATVSKNKNSCTVKKLKGKKFSSKKTYYVYVKTVCNKGKSKNNSGALYYWNTKNTSWGYLN